MMMMSSFASKFFTGVTHITNTLRPDTFGTDSPCLPSPSLKLYAYFLLNFLLNLPNYGLDGMTSQDTGKALIIYSCLEAVNLAMLSNLFYQNNRKVINSLRTTPQENGFKPKLVTGLTAALVATVNLFILQGIVNKILTIVPGIFILSQMKQPEQGMIFRAEALPYLSGTDKSCQLLYINGMDPRKNSLYDNLIADETLMGGNKAFKLCDVLMAQAHTHSQFISALQKGKESFGKVPNLIIAGHGSKLGQQIGSFKFSPNESPQLIEEMKAYLEHNASVILGGCESADPSITYSPDTYAGRVAKLLEGRTVHGFIGSFIGEQVQLVVENGRLIPSMQVRTIKEISPWTKDVTFHPAGTEKVVSYLEEPSKSSSLLDYFYS